MIIFDTTGTIQGARQAYCMRLAIVNGLPDMSGGQNSINGIIKAAAGKPIIYDWEPGGFNAAQLPTAHAIADAHWSNGGGEVGIYNFGLPNTGHHAAFGDSYYQASEAQMPLLAAFAKEMTYGCISAYWTQPATTLQTMSSDLAISIGQAHRLDLMPLVFIDLMQLSNNAESATPMGEVALTMILDLCRGLSAIPCIWRGSAASVMPTNLVSIVGRYVNQ